MTVVTTTSNLSTVGSILKDYYLPPVVDQLNSKVLLLSRVDKDNDSIFGNQAVVPLHTKRSGGIGGAGEDQNLPSAGAQGYDRATYDLKYLYGRLRVTGPAMEKTSKEAGSFLQILKSEIDGLRQDLQMDLSRQIYGTGDAVIAQCAAAGPSTVVTLNSTSGKEAIRKGFLYIGMRVDIATAAGVYLTSNSEIVDVTLATPSITISDSVTTLTTHFVIRAGAATGGALTAGATNIVEINGLQQIVAASTSPLGGINPASAGKGYWDNQRDTSTSTLTLDPLQQAVNQAQIAGAEPTLLLGSFGMQRKLFLLLQGQQRFVNTEEFKGGFKALDYAGRPFVADRHAPFGKIYILDERFLKVFANNDWHWLNEDGDILKWVIGKDAWEAVLARYMQFGATRRNTQMVMTNLSTDDPNGF